MNSILTTRQELVNYIWQMESIYRDSLMMIWWMEGLTFIEMTERWYRAFGRITFWCPLSKMRMMSNIDLIIQLQNLFIIGIFSIREFYGFGCRWYDEFNWLTILIFILHCKICPIWNCFWFWPVPHSVLVLVCFCQEWVFHCFWRQILIFVCISLLLVYQCFWPYHVLAMH